ncbi:hypothetical protein A8135_14235 [Legionella jamestowniensis]|uniref:Transmembrane protein n=1 Tax=Legionella jamestowniensis TaxID=455 RepID=A0ABX2XSM2_9GAMM|nr:hypothetical protein A8135_14235 [Legionella jamestowniensis]
MERKRFSVLLIASHIVALFGMLLLISIIKKFTLLLYVKPYQELNLLQLFNYLWFSQDYFLRLILIFNFIVKPVFIYVVVFFAFFSLIKNREHS